MSLGFANQGFRVLGGYDNWSCAVDTYNKNHEGSKAKLLDLGDVDAAVEELSRYRMADGKFPAIIGGPPCQDFSSAGNRVEGARADLTEKFASVVTHFSPPFFVMENVSNAAQAFVYNRALGLMRESGYRVETVLLNAAHTGVPQMRKRLIAFGARDPMFVKRVIETWQKNLSPYPMTIREYFGDSLEFTHYYRHPRSYARRGVFSIDEPSPTIRGVNRPIPPNYEQHPADPVPASGLRPLTTRERAQIQTFPPDFEFSCSRTNAEQLIGNAVPVKLAEYIAKGIGGQY